MSKQIGVSAFQQGEAAFREGKRPKDNPCVRGSRGFKQWDQGYTSAKRKPTKGKQ